MTIKDEAGPQTPPAVGEFAVSEREQLLARIDAQAREIDRYRSALDSIATKASQSRSVTRRLTWIEGKAQAALENKPWAAHVFMMPEPKNSLPKAERLREENLRLKGELAALTASAPNHSEQVREVNYKRKFECLVEHAKRQDQVISELRYDENIRRFYDDGAVWFWAGNETDNLETLACPVVINAGDLRALLAAAPSAGSQDQGEAVEVVCITQGGCNVTWTATKELTPAGTALMTVAQHQRIMAAATHPADQVAEGVVVSRELLQEIVELHRRRGVVLIIHIEQLADQLAKSCSR